MTDPNQPPANFRLRLVFAKKAQVKYISHLDLSLTWERALRRAQIPLAYSKGFNPRPKIQFASGLPLGTTGAAEIVDIVTTELVEPGEAQARITAVLPHGIGLHSVATVELKSPSLQHQLRQAEYQVRVETDLPEATLAERIDGLLAANSLIRTRRRRNRDEEFDLRPWLHQLRLSRADEASLLLTMRVTAGQLGNLRPEDVLKALGLADNWTETERTRLIFESDLQRE